MSITACGNGEVVSTPMRRGLKRAWPWRGRGRARGSSQYPDEKGIETLVGLGAADAAVEVVSTPMRRGLKPVRLALHLAPPLEVVSTPMRRGLKQSGMVGPMIPATLK